MGTIQRVVGGRPGQNNGRLARGTYQYRQNQARHFYMRVNGRNTRVRFRCCNRRVVKVTNGGAHWGRCGAAPALRWCTGRVTVKNGLRPTAPFGSRCIHAPGAWRANKWCSIAHNNGPGLWGWACICNPTGRLRGNRAAGQPYCQANGACYRNGQSVLLRRGQFATRIYTASVTSSRRVANKCVYVLRFADGDVETNVAAIRLRKNNARSYTVCQRFQGNYRGRGRWYSARVTSVVGGGRYKVQYDDGDQEILNAAQLKAVAG